MGSHLVERAACPFKTRTGPIRGVSISNWYNVMSRDPIVEEVRSYRLEYGKRFNYDLQAIYRDLKEKQEKSGRKVVSFVSLVN